MQLGIHLPHAGEQATPALIRRHAMRAEDLGFADIWVSEHIIALLQDPARLARMAASAEKLGIRDADRSMAELVLEAAAPVQEKTAKSKPAKHGRKR